MREILPVEQKQHREQRQMITREQVSHGTTTWMC